jgi:hypothetical protein
VQSEDTLPTNAEFEELQEQLDETDKALSTERRKNRELAPRVSAVGDMAEVVGATAVAYGASYADARIPGDKGDKGTVHAVAGGMAAVVGIMGRKSPMVRSAAKIVALGTGCAIAAKEGRTKGLKDKLKAEAAKAAATPPGGTIA